LEKNSSIFLISQNEKRKKEKPLSIMIGMLYFFGVCWVSVVHEYIHRMNAWKYPTNIFVRKAKGHNISEGMASRWGHSFSQ
jgi:hypothetical protein